MEDSKTLGAAGAASQVFLTEAEIAAAQERGRTADRLARMIGITEPTEFARMLEEIVVARRFRDALGVMEWPTLWELSGKHLDPLRRAIQRSQLWR